MPVDFASVEYIVSNTSIAEAWKKVGSNKGAPGVDHISIEQFPEWGRPQWEDIKKRILEGNYKPTPVLRVEIPKESGWVCKLGIPCVLDRVIKQSIANVLGDLFNSTFSNASYGYRPGCSVRQAARKVADTGFANETHKKYLHDNNINAYIPDNQFRSRDPKFQDQKQKYPRPSRAKETIIYPASHFSFDPVTMECICPSGKTLSPRGTVEDKHGNQSVRFEGRLTQCRHTNSINTA